MDLGVIQQFEGEDLTGLWDMQCPQGPELARHVLLLTNKFTSALCTAASGPRPRRMDRESTDVPFVWIQLMLDELAARELA